MIFLNIFSSLLDRKLRKNVRQLQFKITHKKVNFLTIVLVLQFKIYLGINLLFISHSSVNHQSETMFLLMDLI